MFATPADGYDRYIGRYSHQLASDLIQMAGVRRGQRVLDVGCGPGALTTALVEVLAPDSVSAVDASEAYVEACRSRSPGADVRLGVAESLPFPDGEFDAVLAQLVINLLADDEVGVREMARVARPGGVVAAAVWARHGMPLLEAFWDAAAAVAREGVARFGETGTVGYRRQQLGELWGRCGLANVSVGELTSTAVYEDFADLWAPIEAGVGRPGELCRSLEPEARERLHSEMHRRLGAPPGEFRLTASAWWARGTVPRAADVEDLRADRS